jgi:hypothetical protein
MINWTIDIVGTEEIGMELLVYPEVFDRFPGARLIVVIAHSIDNQRALPDIAAL